MALAISHTKLRPSGVALIDWDETHVDIPNLDLVLPHNDAGLDDRRMTSPRKHGPRGKPRSAGTTSTQSGNSLKFERSELQRPRRSLVGGTIAHGNEEKNAVAQPAF